MSSNQNTVENPNGKIFGYIRMSSPSQNLENQRVALEQKNFNFDKIYEDVLSGKNIERPGFQRLLEMVRDGDWVVVTSLDRIGRSLIDLNQNLNLFKRKNIRLISLREDLDFSTLSGNLIFNVMASVAEYERNLIRERQRIGIEEAKKKGLYKGRKPVPVPANFQQCFEKYKNSTRAEKYTLKMFAQETNLKMSTLLNFITRFRVNW